MTRIRYTDEEGVLVSKPMLAVNDTVVVRINTTNRNVTIDTTSGRNVFHGSGKDLGSLKKMAKTQLKTLGVVFDDEVRRHTNVQD